MIKAILFDLDDTLLGNNVDTFVPKYFNQLGHYTDTLLPHDYFIPLLLKCTDETIKNSDPTLTNHAVFWRAFTRETGLKQADTESFFDKYYRTEFSKLRELTEPRPCAPQLVRHCLDEGLIVVVATNPLFPQTAIEARLAWAGVPVSDFDYALVTSIENMHATKPSTAYYQEILSRIQCEPEEAVMVGDSWENDMRPAAALGMKPFWVPSNDAQAPDETILVGSGSLDEFYELVKQGWLANLE